MQRVSLSENARQLHRHMSMITRETSRTRAPIRRVYGACLAQHKVKERKIQAAHRPRFENAIIRNHVNRHLLMGWTAEQIAGRLRIAHPQDASVSKASTDSLTTQMFGVTKTSSRCFPGYCSPILDPFRMLVFLVDLHIQ